jgi:hypothetical protein
MPDPHSDIDGSTQVLRQEAPALIVTSAGSLEGKILRLDRETQVIGRSTECDLRLDDEFVSQRHAVIRREPFGGVIEDLGSSNGVIVNGEQIDAPMPLRDGDVVRLGNVVFHYVRSGRNVARAEPPRDPAQPLQAPADPQRAREFGVGAQQADAIYQAARDQYIEQQLKLTIAPMRRRARTLLRFGWFLILAGLAIQIGASIAFASEISRIADVRTFEQPDMPFELIVVGFVGGAVFIVGLACVITSLFIRRSARRQEERL